MIDVPGDLDPLIRAAAHGANPLNVALDDSVQAAPNEVHAPRAGESDRGRRRRPIEPHRCAAARYGGRRDNVGKSRGAAPEFIRRRV